MLPSKLQKGLVSVQDPKLQMWPSLSVLLDCLQNDAWNVEMVGWKQCPKNLQTKYSGYKIHNKALAISTHTIIRTCKRQNLFSEVGIRVEMHLQYSIYRTVYESTHTISKSADLLVWPLSADISRTLLTRHGPHLHPPAADPPSTTDTWPPPIHPRTAWRHCPSSGPGPWPAAAARGMKPGGGGTSAGRD